VSGAALAAANNLRIDHGTARVLDAFQEGGVPSILLKGPSVVRWLRRDTPRRYQDCDLLVPPTAIEAAERVLGRLGFKPLLERRRMPSWWQEHAVAWLGDELAVDLHGTLVGVGAGRERLWEVLSARTETMSVGGFPAVVLTPYARALHLALKAAQDGADNGDLERAIPRVPQETWDEAAALARELEATTAFAAGIRLVPDGPELAERLDLPQTQSVELALRGAAPPEALTIDRLSRASGLRERVTIVTRKLFPPPTFIRHWARLEDPGRARLLLAYLRRLRWVARRSPAAFRAWRSARRESPRGRAVGSGDDRQGGDAA
jgi:Uncharacterised nucleotidyltransferase